MSRGDLVGRLTAIMQEWNSVAFEGKDSVIRKGKLNAVSIVTKVRQGKKASTLITNFEPFFLTAEFLCEELQKLCASSTSSGPVQGKPNSIEVHVQGKHIKAVTELLLSQGVPKNYIIAEDLTDKKKKK